MVAVVRHAVAEDLGVHGRASALGRLQLFEHQDTRPLSHHEPGAGRVERT
jgi:hypothetical protein